jgi:hypothetical protein
MEKIGKNKLMPLLLTLTLLFSVFVFMPAGTLAQEAKFYNEFDAEKTVFDDMTPGDLITVKGADLTVDQRYYVYFSDGAGGATLLDDQRADDDGEVEIDVHVPYRDTLGAYEIMLIDDTWANGGLNVSNSPVDVWVNNSYEVKYKSGGEFLDYVLFDYEYYYPEYLEISVWNWTGSKYVIFDEDTVDITLFEPDGTFAVDDTTSTGYWNLDYKFGADGGTNCFENNYWVNVTYDATHYAYQPLPVKLNMTAELPSDPEWGDTITVEGYLYNGSDLPVSYYEVALLSPNEDGFIIVDQEETFLSGRYSLIAPSDENGASAGTWYVGTIEPGAYRIDETDIVDYTDFINYHAFEVAPSDTARVRLEDPDEIVSGFNQDVNISVYNTSWNDNYYYDEMWIHITGLETVYDGGFYDEDDIITLGNFASNGTGYSTNEKYAFYEFDDLKFNETGKCTIIVTWDMNNTYYEEIDDLQANITGSDDFDVVSPDDMNIIISDMVDAVCVDDSDPCCWVNCSNLITIEVYGDSQDDRWNASIYITGAGLDIEIEEEDAIDDGYWISEGVYQVDVSPMTAGTVTVTCVNDTENMSATKDYSISGLAGSVTTSEGDDKEISVMHTETIILTVTYGQYSEVHLCYYDKTWDLATYYSPECLNETIGDGTAGNGLNGVFEFTPDVEDIDHVGYIVVAAKAGENYMYDIIEIAPVHDLVVEIIDPDNESLQTLTAGLEHDWEFKIMDSEGDLVDDIEYVLAEVLDEDEDTVQEYYLKEKAGSIWYMDDWVPHFTGDLLITAWNNTGEDEHDGNITFMIDCATITFSPEGVTAGVEWEDINVEVIALDANGMPLPEGTRLYINVENDTSIDVDDQFTVDEDGIGDFDIDCVGDVETFINLTLQDWYEEDYMGNLTCGTFDIHWPTFILDPDTIYIGQPNTITITAKDYNDQPIEGINLTLYGSASLLSGGIAPDPVMTDADGKLSLSVNPIASGKLNVTIVRELIWTGEGVLDWEASDKVITDTIVDITSLKMLSISLSQSPIYEGQTLTVTVMSGNMVVEDAWVTFGQDKVKTDSNGEASFTAPDPGVESALYNVDAEKTGYYSADKQVTVIKLWEITVVGLPEKLTAGKKVTVTLIAKGMPLAGATFEVNGEEYTSDGEGKITFKLPKAGTYTVKASYGNYQPVEFDITIGKEADGTPGFELISLLAAIGVAYILLKRRRR